MGDIQHRQEDIQLHKGDIQSRQGDIQLRQGDYVTVNEIYNIVRTYV